MPRRKTFYACDGFTPVRVDHEVGTAAWLARTLGATCAGAQTGSITGVTALSESFFKFLVAGNQKTSRASFSLHLCPFGQFAWGPSLLFSPLGTYRGPPWLESYYVVLHISHLKGHPGWGPTLKFSGQAFDGPTSLLFSCQCWHVGGERPW